MQTARLPNPCPTCGQPTKSLGERIRECRAAKDWTRAEAAKRVDVTAGRWTNWELDNMRPRPEQLAALAALFEVPPEHFGAQAQ